MLRQLVFLLSLIALLAACGAPAAPVAVDAPTAAPTGAPVAPAATSAAQPAASDLPERLRLLEEQIVKARTAPLALAPVETTAEYRLVKHALGEARVPLNPQRIVTLEPSLTDAVAALGLGDRIVGTVQEGDAFHAHIVPFLGPDVAKLGSESEPNLEAIALAKPDLILTWDWYPDPVPQLQQIAPTVVLPYAEYEARIGKTYSDEQYITWLVREVAAVLGADDEVEPVMESYRASVAAGRAQLEQALGNQTVVLLDVRVEKILLSGYGFDGISALLYGDLRVRPDPLSEQFYTWEELSLERIPELTADYILTFADGEDAEKRLAELLQNPLWQQVPAVKNGKVYTVPSGLYYRGDDGPLGASQVIADIVAKLAGSTAAAPSPDPAALQVIEETAEYRLIKHSLGETRVPLQPKRVVTLQDQNALLPLFELGFTDVVGSVGDFNPDGTSYFRRMQDFDTSRVQFVGRVYEPNLEAIAALKPDLIVAGPYEITEENYDLLSAIAPTVVIQQFTRPIWASHADFALLVNRQAEAQALKERFDASLAKIKAQINNPESITVSLFYVGEGGTINAEANPNLPSHTVFDQLGLGQIELIEQARTKNQFYAYEENVSLELLPQFDGDLVFVPYWGGAPGPDLATLQASPLWKQLNAVQKGQAYIIPGEQWYGLSYQPLFNILDGIEQYVIDAQPDVSWEPTP